MFDSLNRNGEALTRQELRNAKYHSSPLYRLVRELAQLPHFEIIFRKLQTNRLEHQEFVSELLFALIENQVMVGDNPTLLDEMYDRYTSDITFEGRVPLIRDNFIAITELLSSFQLDFEKYKIQGLSHYYALWLMAMTIYTRHIPQANLPELLDEFFLRFRSNDPDVNIQAYKKSS